LADSDAIDQGVASFKVVVIGEQAVGCVGGGFLGALCAGDRGGWRG
jgi:hypothetical protein